MHAKWLSRTSASTALAQNPKPPTQYEITANVRLRGRNPRLINLFNMKESFDIEHSLVQKL